MGFPSFDVLAVRIFDFFEAPAGPSQRTGTLESFMPLSGNRDDENGYDDLGCEGRTSRVPLGGMNDSKVARARGEIIHLAKLLHTTRSPSQTRVNQGSGGFFSCNWD